MKFFPLTRQESDIEHIHLTPYGEQPRGSSNLSVVLWVIVLALGTVGAVQYAKADQVDPCDPVDVAFPINSDSHYVNLFTSGSGLATDWQFVSVSGVAIRNHTGSDVFDVELTLDRSQDPSWDSNFNPPIVWVYEDPNNACFDSIKASNNANHSCKSALTQVSMPLTFAADVVPSHGAAEVEGEYLVQYIQQYTASLFTAYKHGIQTGKQIGRSTLTRLGTEGDLNPHLDLVAADYEQVFSVCEAI